MKTKKLGKKLVLNKRTIAPLGREHMGEANGGDVTDTVASIVTCYTYCYDCSLGLSCEVMTCDATCTTCTIPVGCH